MRDPERIRPFLEKLANKWEQYPDLRFGQLVENIANYFRPGGSWFAEDENWEHAISQFDIVPGKYRGE